MSESERKYRESAQWDSDQPTRQVENLAALLNNARVVSGNILDAGAGLGRNAIFLAKQGFHIRAVEVNDGAISGLRENTKQHNVSDLVDIIHASINDGLHDIADESLVAVVDSGMSHHLDDHAKKIFIDEVKKKLCIGGLFTFLHFSDNEPSAKHMGRSKDFLQTLFADGVLCPVVNWHEITWTDKKTGHQHTAWTAIFKKQNVRNQ